MPPKKSKESIIFIVNIGTVRHGTQSNSNLLDKTKFILKHIIQKKIFLRPKDEIGVILMGTDYDKSDSITGYDNIQELCNMQIANWDLIENINQLEITKQNSSWMEAIYAAIEYINHECIDKSERKIILLSDFNEEEDVINQFKDNEIAQTLNSQEILLIAIGEKALHNTNEDCYTASEALLMNVLQKINGQYLTFEHAMSDVRFYRRPSTKPMPWHCDLQLGDYHIPIVGISKVPTEPKLPEMVLRAKLIASNKPEQVSITNVAQWIDNNRTIHTKDDIIRGYVYGGKAIPVSDDVQKAMIPKINEKCYKIHGFTAKKNIPMEFWISDGTYVIVAASESVSAPFYSLIQAMVEKDVVAIVEKVYRKNCETNMVALFPSVDIPNEPWSLIEIGLPFERDYGAIAKRPLKFALKQLSKEQNDAIDDLLMSLELPDVTDKNSTNDGEKYLPGCMPDPGAQHMWDMLSARALNPDQSLPLIANNVKDLLEQPESVKENCKSTTERVKKLFFLEKKETFKVRRYKRAATDESNHQTDIKKDKSTMQLMKQEDNKNENNDEPENMISLSNACDFDFDEIANM